MNALEPKACTRCRREVPAADPARPESVTSRLFAPANPRPMLPGGTRADGVTVPPTEVSWEIEGDYEKRGSIAALLCQPCVRELTDWIYTRPADGPPAEGDRVRLTYGDGSSVEGTWRGVMEKDDGELHTHTRGHVRRDVVARASVR